MGKAIFITLLSAGIIGAFAWLGWQARDAALPATLEYSKIDCDMPAGLSKQEFLDELRYLGLPETIDLRSESRDRELKAIFERHPQVEKVVSIDERGSGLSIRLQFRTNHLSGSKSTGVRLPSRLSMPT